MKRQKSSYLEIPKKKVFTCSDDSYSTLLFQVEEMLSEIETIYSSGYVIVSTNFLADKFLKKVYAVVIVQPKPSFFSAIKKALGLT